jgi:uncharacterized protein
VQDLKVPVADLLGRPGEYRDIRLSHPFPEVRIALARLTDSPVAVDFKAESVVEGMLVTGRAEAQTTLECARCLRTFAAPLALEVCELFVAPGHEAAAEEDSYRVRGGEIDLGEMMRDALALALPVNPLCSEGCKGLCAGCGADLNAGDCACTDDDVDPRWAALASLRDRLES